MAADPAFRTLSSVETAHMRAEKQRPGQRCSAPRPRSEGVTVNVSKRILLVVILVFVLTLAIALPAQALTIQGGDPSHRLAIMGTLESQPTLLAYVENVYPSFSVHVCFGGYAWLSYIDVSGALSGRAFTNQVAHEFCHEVQRASDEGALSLNVAWHAWLNARGMTTLDWTHSLEDSMRVALFAPYYAFEQPTFATKTEMVALLKSVGIKL